MANLIKVKSFSSIINAQLAQNILREHKIESIIKNSGVSFTGDLGNSFGADIYVSKYDYERSIEILSFMQENNE